MIGTGKRMLPYLLLAKDDWLINLLILWIILGEKREGREE
jgi:hypothetical protein